MEMINKNNELMKMCPNLKFLMYMFNFMNIRISSEINKNIHMHKIMYICTFLQVWCLNIHNDHNIP